MRLSTGRSLAVAVGTTIVAVAVMYVASTWGVAAWSQSQTPQDTGVGAMPITVENAPPSVGTTAQYGPVGTVSMVFAGTDVESGLVGKVDEPWLVIAAHTGGYRALDAPGLPAAQAGAVAINADGDRLAWAGDAGLVVYDTTTDEARTFPVDGASRVGAFSPDGSMLTAYADGLAVVDLESGDVVAEESVPDPDAVRYAAWRADSSAVDYVSGSDLVSVPADGGDPTTQPSPVDEGVPLAWAPLRPRAAAVSARRARSTPPVCRSRTCWASAATGRWPSGPSCPSRAASSGCSTSSSTAARPPT